MRGGPLRKAPPTPGGGRCGYFWRGSIALVWLSRLTDAIRGSDRPVALVGGEAYGAPFILEHLQQQQRMAWAVAYPRSVGDSIEQGNALAEAVNRALDGALFEHALPYTAHLKNLERLSDTLTPMWVALTRAHFAPELVHGLPTLQKLGYRVILDVDEAFLSALDLSAYTVIGAEEMRMQPGEAELFFPRQVSTARVHELYRQHEGRYTPLFAAMQEELRMPPPRIPMAGRPALQQRDAELKPVGPTIDSLMRIDRPLEALDLACRAAPHLVEGLLRKTGPAYQSHGLFERLHLLLSSLPDEIRDRPTVMEWRLVASIGAHDTRAIVPEADACLAEHRAPNLLARRAGLENWEVGFPMAEKAYRQAATPLTVWQYGRMHPNPDAAISTLRRAVNLAEESNDPYGVFRAAGTLGGAYANRGQYEQARAWTSHALKTADEHRIRDGNRRLLVFNDYAVARIMLGDTTGLRRTLEDAHIALEDVRPTLARTFRSTLAWLEFATDRAEHALSLAQAAYDGALRVHKTRFAFDYVHALQEVDRHDEACAIAREAIELTHVDSEDQRLQLLLLNGIVGACDRDESVAEDLLEVARTPIRLAAEFRYRAALYYLLLRPAGHADLPPDLLAALRGLAPTAQRVLSGPLELLAPIWDSLKHPTPDAAPLRLHLFGRPHAHYRGQVPKLTPRHAEIAYVLALHPQGLTLEQLHAALTPDGKSTRVNTLKTQLSHLRRVLPDAISHAPYRFTVPFEFDVLDLQQLLHDGEARAAIRMSERDLLPKTESPAVVEHREALHEELRQVVLAHGDATELYDLADRLHDDPELWERTVHALSNNDKRRPYAIARWSRLMRELHGELEAEKIIRATTTA